MEDVTPAAARKTGQMQTQTTLTTLIVRSTSFNWVGLRATVESWPDMRIVADVQQRELALQVATRDQPHLVFAASDLVGVPPVAFVRELRAISSTSQIIMIGKLLEHEEHSWLTDLDLAGFLQWKCVTPERLRHIVEVVRDGEVRAASTGAVRVLHPPEHRRQPRDANTPVLTTKERTVLMGLIAGQTQPHIADTAGVSVRAIEERIASLKDKFGVATTFMLGVMAERAGLIP